MSVYVGTPTGTAGVVDLPICFTGWHASIMYNFVVNIEALAGAVVGVAVSMIAMLVMAGPEFVLFPPVAIGAAILGAILGGVFGVLVLNRSACTCPAGAYGFCVCLMLLIVPGTSVAIPLWPFFKPCPGSCAVLVPPGCP